MGVVGCSTWLILMVMCGGFRSRSFAFSGYISCVVLYSFLSFASLPICLSFAREMGCLSCTGLAVSCLVGYIDHISVAMSWYLWRSVMTLVATESIWSVVAVSLVSKVVMVCVAYFVDSGIVVVA